MRVVVARVGRALGVRGDSLVDVLTDEPERRLVAGSRVVAGDRTLVIASARPHGNRLAVHFEGIDDRTLAEALTGTLLEVDRDPAERPDDPEEFYDEDLQGLAVISVGGDHIGVITEVIHLPAQDLLAAQTADGREVLIPFVAEIVPEVNLDEGRLVIDPPPGLLAVNAPEDSDDGAAPRAESADDQRA